MCDCAWTFYWCYHVEKPQLRPRIFISTSSKKISSLWNPPPKHYHSTLSTSIHLPGIANNRNRFPPMFVKTASHLWSIEYWMGVNGCQHCINKDYRQSLPPFRTLSQFSWQLAWKLYGVNTDVLKRFIVSNIAFLSLSIICTYRGYRLTGYLASFLQDQSHSQLYYCDPILHHIFILSSFVFWFPIKII